MDLCGLPQRVARAAAERFDLHPAVVGHHHALRSTDRLGRHRLVAADQQRHPRRLRCRDRGAEVLAQRGQPHALHDADREQRPDLCRLIEPGEGVRPGSRPLPSAASDPDPRHPHRQWRLQHARGQRPDDQPPGHRTRRRPGIRRVGGRAQRHRHQHVGAQLPDRLSHRGGTAAGLQPQLGTEPDHSQPCRNGDRLERPGQHLQRSGHGERHRRRRGIRRDPLDTDAPGWALQPGRSDPPARHAKRTIGGGAEPARAARTRPDPAGAGQWQWSRPGNRRRSGRAQRDGRESDVRGLPHRVPFPTRFTAAGVEPELRRQPGHPQPGHHAA